MAFPYQKHHSMTPFARGTTGNQTICHPTALVAKHFQWITPCPVSVVGTRCCNTMSSEISPPAFCWKSVTMWHSNHLYNPSVVSSSIVQQMPPKKHAGTSVQEDSGVIASQVTFRRKGFPPECSVCHKAPLVSQYVKHERSMGREYEQRVREIEGASFVPLIFSTTGGMGPACTTTSPTCSVKSWTPLTLPC